MKSTEKPQNPDAYTVNNTQNSQKKYKYKKESKSNRPRWMIFQKQRVHTVGNLLLV